LTFSIVFNCEGAKMATLDIKTLRDSLSAGGGRWVADNTAFSALSEAEFLVRLGAEPPASEVSLAARVTSAALNASVARVAGFAAVPSLVDWRAADGKNYLSAVRDQANCGSCVAFGTVATIEGGTRVTSKNANLVFDLSEAHLFYCHGAADGRNCGNGWWPNRALDAAKNKGIVDEACFPYTAGDQACRTCADAASRTTKIKSWTSLATVTDMQNWLATKGPLVACFTVYEDFRYYRSGVYHHLTGAALGGHCVCVVGYSLADQAWIARNSWGPDWGEAGHFRIGFGEAGFDYEMWGVEVDAKPAIDDVVKLEKVLITGLWVNVGAPLAQCYVDKVGWRKLPSPEMVTAAAAARVSKALCTMAIKGDTITELYVF
jgi:C1A family cysteine protease